MSTGKYAKQFLPFHIYSCFSHFIANSYYFSIRLKTTLGYNHICKFICHIDIRHLKCS